MSEQITFTPNYARTIDCFCGRETDLLKMDNSQVPNTVLHRGRCMNCDAEIIFQFSWKEKKK